MPGVGSPIVVRLQGRQVGGGQQQEGTEIDIGVRHVVHRPRNIVPAQPEQRAFRGRAQPGGGAAVIFRGLGERHQRVQFHLHGGIVDAAARSLIRAVSLDDQCRSRTRTRRPLSSPTGSPPARLILFSLRTRSRPQGSAHLIFESSAHGPAKLLNLVGELRFQVRLESSHCRQQRLRERVPNLLLMQAFSTLLNECQGLSAYARTRSELVSGPGCADSGNVPSRDNSSVSNR